MSSIETIVREMTLEEKAKMCSGANWFETEAVERLGVPAMQMFDGPNGLRKSAARRDKDGLGHYKAVESTCFPTGSAMAASWDTDLLFKIGQYMGEECQAEEVPLLLGPAINMKRSPLCGRNFEYLTEDPYLCGKLAAALVNGVHSQGVGACLKHFAANSQEERRLSVNSVIDERTLREIYLAGFEIAVKESRPETIMCAYNKVNGKHCSKNEHLLTEILRDEWGYDGFVMTDWGAMKDRVESLKAGLELEMPYSGTENEQKIVEAVKNGSLSEEILDQAVERILKVVFKLTGNQKEDASYDKEEHHRFARRAAAECMVLLKNEERILPLKKESSICLLGEMAEKTRYQGGGSSHVTTYAQDNILSEMSAKAPQISYAKGYCLDGEENEAYLKEAVELAASKDAAVIVVGLPDGCETEFVDRTSMKMPQSHIRLIQKVAEVNPNIVVVLLNGSPVEMEWQRSAKGILEAYLGGQAAAGAVSDILFGDVNPSAKLAETFPVQLEDNPSYLNYGLDEYEVNYSEGVYIGYRYYDKKNMQVRYPFGHGLSYTEFEYSDLRADKSEMNDSDVLTVRLWVKNVGACHGKEVVQLYVAPEDAKGRPLRELKGFAKVSLEPGEQKEVCFTLDKRAFAFYSEQLHDWHVKSGIYSVQVGSSSRDIRKECGIKVHSTQTVKKHFHEDIIIGEILQDERTRGLLEEMLTLYAPEVFKDREKTGLFNNMPLRQAHLFSKGSLSEKTMEEYMKKFNEAVQERSLE